MLNLLLTLLVALIIIGLVYWCVHAIAGAFGIPAPIVAVLDVVLVIVFILFLLNLFGLVSIGSIGSIRLR